MNARIDPSLAAALAAAVGADGLLTDPADCWTYGYDNSKGQALPIAVVLPRDTAAVQAAVQACREARRSLTPRGRGTGTTGAAVPEDGGVVMSMERMDRILRIDPANRVAVVQPGVTNGALQAAAAAKGFFWPPDPGSADYCTVGGNLACNAAGPRALKYGTPRENTLGLEAVTGEGRIIRCGCYTTKGVVGLDLTRLLIGSEGTLGIVTEATLKLTPLPEATVTVRAAYRDMHAAAAAVSRLMAQPVVPRVVEFLDGAALALLRAGEPLDLPPGAGALLMIEADGLAAQLPPAVEALRRAASGDGLVEWRAADDAAEARALWAARKALSPALRTLAPRKINEDVVVPVSRLGELTDQLARLAEQHRVRIVTFGHAGNGNLHVNVLGEDADLERMQACVEDVFRAVLALGGTLSGEHGVGRSKREFVALELDAETLAVMRAVKRVFDPDGILNPGKSLPDPA
ncbi:FAD-linked oxidase C-terminal domain-containing protein [Thioalkalivibrio sp. XN8]|uniref:FAD-binding oxidoreductase n=1 Tax=Thioalkalivibrio sp. XN8 TaxID=2712863 RepID=UPI0013ECAE77|nr:FAD-linked oxidase C-terminal domain-containing protein [Thioalkalivibrio sp. XN8]NGP52188.1 FAD-binding protein [Thioalkalivibrio sp. XN8]